MFEPTHDQCRKAAAHALAAADAIHKPIRIFPIPRGGVPAAYLFKQMNNVIEIVDDIEKADFLVDDIVDSGSTVARYRKIFGAPRKVLALFTKTSSPRDAAVFVSAVIEDDQWVVFPWERTDGNKEDGISSTIRNRIEAAGSPFFANDNIAAFIEDGEHEKLQDEVESKVRALLHSMVIDVDRDHNTKETAKRVAKMYMKEVFKGRYHAAPSITDFPNAKELGELYVTGPITIRSACSHHFVPILGKAWIGIIPGDRVIGLSKFNRLVEWIACRPQIQEEMAVQIADEIESRIKPRGLAVIVKASHMCMNWRGVKEPMEAAMTTSVMRGALMEDHAARAEFLSLIKL